MDDQNMSDTRLSAAVSRQVRHGTQQSRVEANDEPGPGNACHRYSICNVPESANEPTVVFAQISFQKGPIKETEVNGIHNEDLLAIVIDRLEGFQSGNFSCRENALALTKIQEAMHWLNYRTRGRRNRGVEGTSGV